MTTAGNPDENRPVPRRAPATGHTARTRQWLRRAATSGSHERDTLLVVAKSTVAACVAWFLAQRVMHAQSPAFAPFSAVLMMQITVYQSVLQALRYVAAVAAGVALQGLFGFLAGPDLLTFALVAAGALLIGRWRPLGSQGSQVATAAFFAFSTYLSAVSTAERFSGLGQIVVLVLLGCGVGVLVNLVLFPPLRYRGTEYGVRTLAHGLCDLISDICAALREEQLGEERTRQWRHRGTDLNSTVAQARSMADTAWESLYYNPRRLLGRSRRSTDFTGYRAVLDALERVSYQVASMTRSLDEWHDDAAEDQERARWGAFLRAYGDFLASIATITHLLGQLDEDRLRLQARELCQAGEAAQTCRDGLAEHADVEALPVSDLARPYGILLVEASRLMEEVQYTCDTLQHSIDAVSPRAV
jgi:uncharacterized membrane protein YgaE (UPF0421/DUF939 family)